MADIIRDRCEASVPGTCPGHVKAPLQLLNSG